MNILHSEANRCDTWSICGKCFNNLIDPRGFTLMTTPKVATQAIEVAYKKSAPRLVRWSSKSMVEQKCQQHLIVGFVRNPFSRLVSCWMDKCINKPGHRTWPLYGMHGRMTFEEFARRACEIPHAEADKHWRLQSFDMFTSDGRQLPQVIVHFENLADEWAAAADQIEKRTRARLGALPHVHASGHKPWREYYTPELIELVGNYYQDDLINFDYSFDEQAGLLAGGLAV